MKSVFVVLFVGLCQFVFAQARYELGALPSININKKLENGYRLNFKTESRHLFEEGEFREDIPFQHDHELIDFALVGSKKIGVNRLALGYQSRFREGDYVHRIIQQYSITKQKEGYRLGHRFATDQTIQEDEDTAYRFRYRLSGLFPLNGDEVNDKENYLKVNHEYLNAFQGDDYDLEIRLVPVIGRQFNDNNKLEFGLDYRINSFVNDASRSRFFAVANWYISF